MITIDCEQGSPEWFEEKAGVPSASHFKEIVHKDGKPSKSGHALVRKLAGEALGAREPGYSNKAMERGIEMEDKAAQLYKMIHPDAEIQKKGFCYPDNQKKYGCSPDRLIGEDGGLEIKCPEKIHIHVDRMLKPDSLITEFKQQVQGCLLVTGREWWDVMSYFPDLDPVIIRVYPDKPFLKLLSAELEKFVYALAATIRELKEKAK